MLDELSKAYEIAGKQLFKTKQSLVGIKASILIFIQMKRKKKKQINKKKCLKIFSTISRKNMMIKLNTQVKLKNKKRRKESKRLKNYKSVLRQFRLNIKKQER